MHERQSRAEVNVRFDKMHRGVILSDKRKRATPYTGTELSQTKGPDIYFLFENLLQDKIQF